MSEQDGEGMRVGGFSAVVREVHAWAKELVPPGISMVDELIADRRAEAARETTKAAEDVASKGARVA